VEHSESFINRSIEKGPYPGISEEKLSIEVTTYCNNTCSHCFARAGISKRSSLTVDLVKDIIGEGYSIAYRHLHITGGEPLLWDGLFEALDYAFDLGYETVFLNTNGTLLSDDVNSRLASYDGLSISVSLQGREGLHDFVRGKGSYRRAVLGIEKALDAGIDLLIFVTACKSLIPDLLHFADETYKEFPSLKCLTLIQLIRVTGDIFDLSKELLDPDDFLRLVRMVSLLNLYGLKIDLLNNPLACVASKFLEMPWVPKSHPLYRDGSIIVMADRLMTLSHSTRDSFGKYGPGMIEKVLTSDEYRNATAQDESTCPSCKHVSLCIPGSGLKLEK